MTITGMKHFESVCKKKLAEWYAENQSSPIEPEDVYKKLTNTCHTEE